MPRVACPNCTKVYQVSDQSLGGRAQCKSCGETFTLSVALDETRGPTSRANAVASPPDARSPDTTAAGGGRPAASKPPRRGPIQESKAKADNKHLPKKIGRFDIRDRLGAGAFGTVYRAWDPVLEREVALKVPQASAMETEQARARFLREAKSAAQLHHPNIVPIYDTGSDGEHLYIASAFIEGRTLAQVIEEDKPDLRQTADIIAKLADALYYAHEQGIVHRDIKPANIMLDTKGEPHLMDFGLAAWEESKEKLTQDGTVMGTPAYMSPEQAGEPGLEVAPGSDQYSLGVVLYELLTGQRPFSGPIANLIYQIRNEEPTAPRSLNQHIPRDLETICLKTMQRHPAHRFTSCHGMAEDLQRWLDKEPIHARRMSTVERISRWTRRNPALASLSAAIVIVALMGMILITLQWRRAEANLAEANRQRAEANRQREQAQANAAEADRQRDTANQKATEAAANLKRAKAAAEAERRAKEQTVAQRERAEQQMYYSRFYRAAGEIEVGRYAKAAEVLRSIPFAQRQWEARYLVRKAAGTPFTLRGHESVLNSVAFSPDGQWIVSGSNDDSVRLWDAETGTQTLALHGHDDAVVAFSPDGRRIVSGGSDQTVKVWDMETGTESLTLRGHKGSIETVAFSPDGQRIVSAGGGIDYETKRYFGELKIWDVKSGEEVLPLRGHSSLVNSLAFSPNGRYLVSGSSDNTVKVWDAITGAEMLTFRGHDDEVKSVAFSPDRRHIASGSVNNTIKVWIAQSGKETVTLRGHKGSIKSVAFSPDGQRIVSGGSDDILRVWDAKTGKEILTLRGHEGSVASVAFSPDGRRIVSGSYDKTVKVWDAESGTETPDLRGHKESVNSIAFSPDGRRIASSSDDHLVKVWDVKTRTETLTLSGHKSPVTSVDFSPDGRRIVTGSNDTTVKLWDAETGMEMLTLRGHERPITSVAFSPDGQFASGSSHHTVKIWDAEKGSEILALRDDEDWITSVAFSPDGRQIVTGTNDREVKIWNAETGIKTLTTSGHAGGVTHVAFSPDGQRIVSGSSDKTAKVWDAESGTVLLNLRGHEGHVNCVAFSPDGQRIVSCGDDQVVKIWNAETGLEMLSLRDHESELNSVAFSPDGRKIASGGEDKTVKLWDAESATQAFALPGHQGRVTSAEFSPDGTRIVSGGQDNMVRIWDVETGSERLTLRGHEQRVSSVAFSPDGRLIASASTDFSSNKLDDQFKKLLGPRLLAKGAEDVFIRENGRVKVWDAETGAAMLTLDGHEDGVTSVAFSTDGRWLVSRDESGREIVWDADTGKQISGEPRPTTLERKVYTKDGLLRVVPNGDRVDVIRTNPEVDLWAEDAARRVAWEPMWCERDAAKSEAAQNWFAARFYLHRLSYLKPDDETVQARLKQAEAKLAVIQDRQGALSTGSYLWDATSGKEALTLKGNNFVISVAFSSDGKRLAAADLLEGIKVWDANTGHETLAVGGPGVFDVAFSPVGNSLAIASMNGTVQICDARSGKKKLMVKAFNTHGSLVGHTVTFSPDGKRLVSGAHETMRVLDATSGRVLLTLKGHLSAAYSPQETRLATPSNETVKIWDATSGKELRTLKGHTKGVNSVAFSPDGKRVASGSFDNTVRIWDALTGQGILTLHGHTNAVRSVAFSPDGRILASASSDRTVKLWDATSGEERLTLKGHTDRVMSVAFSPDGRWLASGSLDKTVRVWDGTPRPSSP